MSMKLFIKIAQIIWFTFNVVSVVYLYLKVLGLYTANEEGLYLITDANLLITEDEYQKPD